MDYEKMYKEALKRVRRLHDRMLVLSSTDALVASSELEFIFPELAESDDERIRMELVAFFKGMQDSDWHEKYWHDLEIDRILAYLEKQKEPENTSASTMAPSCWQKEQKDYNKLYEDIGKSEWFKKAYEGKSLGCDYEQKEQKPDWSEEDEQLLGFIYDLLADSLWNSRYAMSRDECLDRLTSLRQRLQPRPSWKPSKEQMEALKRASTNEYLPAKQFDILVSLYEQLKKLM